MTTSKIGRTYTPWEHHRTVTEFFSLCVPTDFQASKNQMFNRGKRFCGYNPRAKKFREDVQTMALIGMRGMPPFQPKKKVWISMHVEMDKHSGDATNFIEIVFDAIKEVIGVDDRYFSIWKLDWSSGVKDPQIYVAVGQ